MGPETATSVGVVSRLRLTPRTSKSMTEEQVWLLICAVASMELSEFPPHGTALLDCPSEGVILLFILSGTELVHALSLLLGPPSTQGSDVIKNQNTLKFLPNSTLDSFFLDASFFWRLEGRERTKKTPYGINRRPFPHFQTPVEDASPMLRACVYSNAHSPRM